MKSKLDELIEDIKKLKKSHQESISIGTISKYTIALIMLDKFFHVINSEMELHGSYTFFTLSIIPEEWEKLRSVLK